MSHRSDQFSCWKSNRSKQTWICQRRFRQIPPAGLSSNLNRNNSSAKNILFDKNNNSDTPQNEYTNSKHMNKSSSLNVPIHDVTKYNLNHKTHLLTFNVGGARFQCNAKSFTLTHNPMQCKLSDPAFLAKHWDEKRREYFFDRDSTGFRLVLNYLRREALHLPQSMCSSQITSELTYWVVPRIEIEPCCWREYHVGLVSLENLVKLETNRQPAYMDDIHLAHAPIPTTCWQRLRRGAWLMVSDPTSSVKAKIYWIVSLIMVVYSIFLFAISTLPQYQESHVRYSVSWVSISDLVCLAYFLIEMTMILLTCPSPLLFLLSQRGSLEILALVPDLFNITIWGLVIYKANNRAYEKTQRVLGLLILRFLRLIRLLRLLRRVPSLMIIVYSFTSAIKELLNVVLVTIITSLFFASLMYVFQNEDKHFTSVPEGCWWAIITMSTVGYGDIVPVSPEGKIVGVCCALCGILVLGICAPVLVNQFVANYNLLRYMNEREQLYFMYIKQQYIDEKGEEIMYTEC